jgi:hypothetical protein
MTNIPNTMKRVEKPKNLRKIIKIPIFVLNFAISSVLKMSIT